MVLSETLPLQTMADNQGNQNKRQTPETIIAGFEIFQLLTETRKATGFKSLRVNYWKINQLTSKCQMELLEKISRKVNINLEFSIFEIV